MEREEKKPECEKGRRLQTKEGEKGEGGLGGCGGGELEGFVGLLCCCCCWV